MPPMIDVAALFVDPAGPYANRGGVEVWDAARDARIYAGPHPVVAHPPCRLWINLAAVNYARWGGEHNRPGNDGGCFLHALVCVCSFGGVLEHPAHSRAWPKYGLPHPIFGEWSRCDLGWVTEIWQSAYGHRADKATWLFYVGSRAPAGMRWIKVKGTHQIGWFDRRRPVLGQRESALTPPDLAVVLVDLARGSRA
jgi:hypothetical protein